MAVHFFAGEGKQNHSSYIDIPSLCSTCKRKDNSTEENQNCCDQVDTGTFECDAYVAEWEEFIPDAEEDLNR